jgi:KUP system potassium uptake protein
VRFGFAEHPALPPVFATHAKELSIELEDTSFFLGRETPVPTTRPDLALWPEKLFIFMTRNAVSASEYFQIPPRRVVELGTQVELKTPFAPSSIREEGNLAATEQHSSDR